MTVLTALLIVKIVFTLLVISVPFLFFPVKRLNRLMQIQADSTSLYRLYGVAVTALLMAYAGGIYQVTEGVFPTAVIAMGIFSNGAATLVLGLTRVPNNGWLTSFFGLMALGFVLSACFPEKAMYIG